MCTLLLQNVRCLTTDNRTTCASYSNQIMCMSDLVCSSKAGPGLICPSVIVLSFGHLHVITEPDENFRLPQFFNCWPLTQLQREREMERSIIRESHVILTDWCYSYIKIILYYTIPHHNTSSKTILYQTIL